jgi:hypothetical protein
MVNRSEPIYCVEYQDYAIALFLCGEEHLFFAQINDASGKPVGAAPKLYELADAAIDVCKDLIDFLCGNPTFSRECPEERSEGASTILYSNTTRQLTTHVPRMSA